MIPSGPGYALLELYNEYKYGFIKWHGVIP